MSSARAQTRVGEAVLVQNEVLRVSVSSTTPINVGDRLLRDETVRTGADSHSVLTFFDGSESQLGGESQVQIEQVTANPAPQIAFLQTAGVIRSNEQAVGREHEWIDLACHRVEGDRDLVQACGHIDESADELCHTISELRRVAQSHE